MFIDSSRKRAKCWGNIDFIVDTIFTPDFHFFPKSSKSGEKLLELRKEYIELNKTPDLSADHIVQYFVKKYYSILYVDKKITSKDRKIIIETLDSFIGKLQSDETNSNHMDYGHHYQLIKLLCT